MDNAALETSTTKPSVAGILAERVGMTEGQLYTTVIVIAIALLLAITTIPSAHKLQDSTSVPPAPPSPAATP
jgi:hypothetical protein